MFDILPDELIVHIFSFLKKDKSVEPPSPLLSKTDKVKSEPEVSLLEFSLESSMDQAQDVDLNSSEEDNHTSLARVATVCKRFQAIAHDSSLSLFKYKQEKTKDERLAHLIKSEEWEITRKILPRLLEKGLVNPDHKIGGKSLIQLAIERSEPYGSLQLVSFLREQGAKLTKSDLSIAEHLYKKAAYEQFCGMVTSSQEIKEIIDFITEELLEEKNQKKSCNCICF